MAVNAQNAVDKPLTTPFSRGQIIKIISGDVFFMPFDTETISVLESERLMANAFWIERYLVGIAYNAFARPNVSPPYNVLDQNVASCDMPLVVNRLNDELKKFGLKQVPPCSKMADLVNNLRLLLVDSKRAYALDWLIGNENESFWEEAKTKEVWKLEDKALLAFCLELSEKNKAAKAQNEMHR